MNSLLFQRLNSMPEKQNTSLTGNDHFINQKSHSYCSELMIYDKGYDTILKKKNSSNQFKNIKTDTQRFIQEYSQDLSTFYSQKIVSPYDFLNRHEVSVSLRARMIDWIIQVMSSYMMSDLSYFKTVEIIDRYFDCQYSSQPSNCMHLIGITSIFIISKLQQVQPLMLKIIYEKIGHKKFSKQEILEKQAKIMETLNNNLLTCTIYDLAVLTLHQLTLNPSCSIISQNIKSIDQIMVYIGKIVVHSYKTISLYSKQILSLCIVFLSLSCSNTLNQYSKDYLKLMSDKYYNFQQVLSIVGKVVINFDQQYPNLHNLNKFSTVDHLKLISKLKRLGY